MASFGITRDETREDQRRYTSERMVEVGCLDCPARVRVKKNSEHHTSVQWSAEALAQCTEFARLDSSPDGRAVHAVCPRMRASIDGAVADGSIEIGAVDGY